MYDYFTQWLVQGSRTTFSTNQKWNQNQSRLMRAHFPALNVLATCNYFEFWLVYWIVSVLFDWPTLVLVLRHSIETRSVALGEVHVAWRQYSWVFSLNSNYFLGGTSKIFDVMAVRKIGRYEKECYAGYLVLRSLDLRCLKPVSELSSNVLIRRFGTTTLYHVLAML